MGRDKNPGTAKGKKFTGASSTRAAEQVQVPHLLPSRHGELFSGSKAIGGGGAGDAAFGVKAFISAYILAVIQYNPSSLPTADRVSYSNRETSGDGVFPLRVWMLSQGV
eukprot:3778350-Pyramimonas_sp.AAC.1